MWPVSTASGDKHREPQKISGSDHDVRNLLTKYGFGPTQDAMGKNAPMYDATNPERLEPLSNFEQTPIAFGFPLLLFERAPYLDFPRQDFFLGQALRQLRSKHVRPSPDAAALRVRGATLPIARAVENTTTIVAADIAGSQGARRAIGCSRIVNPDGQVLAAAGPSEECLLIADVETRRRQFDPRGWDGHLNPAVTEAFVDL